MDPRFCLLIDMWPDNGARGVGRWGGTERGEGTEGGRVHRGGGKGRGYRGGEGRGEGKEGERVQRGGGKGRGYRRKEGAEGVGYRGGRVVQKGEKVQRVVRVQRGEGKGVGTERGGKGRGCRMMVQKEEREKLGRKGGGKEDGEEGKGECIDGDEGEKAAGESVKKRRECRGEENRGVGGEDGPRSENGEEGERR